MPAAPKLGKAGRFFALRISFILLCLCLRVPAQTQPAPQPDPLMSLMMAQPKVNFDAPVIAVPTLSPSIVRPGEESIYRVTFNAMQDSIVWPTNIIAPGLQVRQTASGQLLQMTPSQLEPHTTFNHRLRADKPGTYTIPEFAVQVYGKPVKVPSIALEVSKDAPAAAASSQMLFLEIPETNVWVGQSVRARVILPAGPGGAVQGITQVQLNGRGFIADPSAVRQSVQMVPRPGGGTPAPSFIYETAFTPIRSGQISMFAQGFAAGNRFGGGVVITGPAVIQGGMPPMNLLESDLAIITVKPLPLQDELPGFTGAIGLFQTDRPILSGERLKVGEPVKISMIVRGRDSQARLVAPPPPLSRDWQIFPVTPAVPNAAGPNQAFIVNANQPVLLGAAKFEYTLVPLNDETETTPVIPFCAFNPETGTYYDLSIPGVPVKIAPSAVPVNAAALAQAGETKPKSAKEPVLGALASDPGSRAGSLIPVQHRSWFPVVQLTPGLVFLALWYWDRRRRFLDSHPEVVRRRRALRMLKRERRALRKAARENNASDFAGAALRAMRAAAAPHYPAEPRALVGADILPLLATTTGTEETGEVVRTVFATCDATQFSDRNGNGTRLEDLLQFQTGIEKVLMELESRLEAEA